MITKSLTAMIVTIGRKRSKKRCWRNLAFLSSFYHLYQSSPYNALTNSKIQSRTTSAQAVPLIKSKQPRYHCEFGSKPRSQSPFSRVKNKANNKNKKPPIINPQQAAAHSALTHTLLPLRANWPLSPARHGTFEILLLCLGHRRGEVEWRGWWVLDCA